MCKGMVIVPSCSFVAIYPSLSAMRERVEMSEENSTQELAYSCGRCWCCGVRDVVDYTL